MILISLGSVDGRRFAFGRRAIGAADAFTIDTHHLIWAICIFRASRHAESTAVKADKAGAVVRPIWARINTVNVFLALRYGWRISVGIGVRICIGIGIGIGIGVRIGIEG